LQRAADNRPPAAWRRWLGTAFGLTVLTTLIVASPASASTIGPESPHSPNADSISTAYWVMLVLGVIAIVAFHLVLFRAVSRYRDRRGRQPARETAGRGVLPRAVLGFGALAVAVLVFGIVITADTRDVEASGENGLQANAARLAQVGVGNVAPDETTGAEAGATGEQTTGGGPLQINAIAQQWLWRFEYPGNDPQGSPRFSYGELVVPVDTAVQLNITSTDVMHSWWVPSLGGQAQAVPGSVSETWFKADQEGLYAGASTNFSGTAYPAMRAWVRVVTADDYRAYVEDLQRKLLDAQGIVQKQVTQGTGPVGETTP
jgi:cytochrome c oxidase subunit 2